MENQKMSAEEILHAYMDNFSRSIPEHNARIDFLKKELDTSIKNKDSHLICLLNNELIQQRATIDKCKTLLAFCHKLLMQIESRK